MIDDFASKLADVITDYSTEVKSGEFVVIIGNVAATPLVEALYTTVMRRGANPSVHMVLPGTFELRLMLAEDAQLDFVDPIRTLIYEEADVILQIDSPSNTRALASSDPAKVRRFQRAMRPLVETQLRRMGDKSLRWCLMPWPSDGAAQQADMGTHAYTEFLYRACGLDREDPVQHWAGLREQQHELVSFLNEKKHMAVRGPGIDLSFSIKGRMWVNAHGKVNFPDGEIFTGPVEDSVNGTVSFNLPNLAEGREVDGVSLTFRDGRVVQARAKKGEAFLLSQLDMDEGARRLGEFAIGNNWGIDRVTGSTLLDEKMGGTIHMALGASLPDTGGANESRLHWDMVHDMKDGGEILVDGEPFYRGGRFLR